MDNPSSDGNIPNIPNLVKATKQQLMEGYKILLRKYQEGARADTQNPPASPAHPYQNTTDIASKIEETRRAVNNSLADAEQKILARFTELKGLEETILAKQAYLREAYEIEEQAGALVALLRGIEDVKFEAERVKEELRQKRQREEEEYKFNLELQKRKDKEQFEAEKRAREVELRSLMEALDQRERTLRAQESELIDLRKQVSEFPDKLASELQHLEQRLVAEASKEKESAIVLLQKELESQKTVLEGKIVALEMTIEDQRRMATSLQEQLKSSQAQVQEVVLKSIEGASGAKTLDVVNKLALEQTRSAQR